MAGEELITCGRRPSRCRRQQQQRLIMFHIHETWQSQPQAQYNNVHDMFLQQQQEQGHHHHGRYLNAENTIRSFTYWRARLQLFFHVYI